MQHVTRTVPSAVAADEVHSDAAVKCCLVSHMYWEFAACLVGDVCLFKPIFSEFYYIYANESCD